jgi:hypothetical protein
MPGRRTPLRHSDSGGRRASDNAGLSYAGVSPPVPWGVRSSRRKRHGDRHEGVLGATRGKARQEADVAKFLEGGRSLVEDEPDTTAWFAVRLSDPRSSAYSGNGMRAFGLLFAASLLAALAFGAVAPNGAQAHRSRCHQAHTCPSDHATYRWYGRAGGRLGRWLCVHRLADERNATFRIRVVYGGRTYYCKR